MALDESQSTSEHQNLFNDANELDNCEQAVDTLPDVVRDADEYLSGDLEFIGRGSLGVGREIEATWSKEAVSSARVLEEEMEDDCDYWNSIDKDDGCGRIIVTINPAYDNKSDDASSRSSLEAISSLDDTFSKGRSSVAEAIDLSDTEQPLKMIGEAAGDVQPTDGKEEQVLVDRQHDYMTSQGMEKNAEIQEYLENKDTSQDFGITADGNSDEETRDDPGTVEAADRGRSGSLLAQNISGEEVKDDVCTADFQNSVTAEIQSTKIPPAEQSSCTTDLTSANEEALQELDAYLNSMVIADGHRSLDNDVLHGSVTNDAARNDDVVASFSSRDDEDVINTVDTDMNNTEERDEVDLDPTQFTAGDISMEVCPVKDQYKDIDDAGHEIDIGQLDDDGDRVPVGMDQPYRVDNSADFLSNQTPIGIDEDIHHEDFKTVSGTDETAEIHEETTAEDLNKVDDQLDQVESSSSKLSSQVVGGTLTGLKGKEEYENVVLLDCNTEVTTTEPIGADVEMADAEVDAILSGAVDQDLCQIRCVSVDEVDPAETDSCMQSCDTSSTGDLVGSGITTSFPVTHKEMQLSPEERLEPDNTNDKSDVRGSGSCKANRIHVPCACTPEAPDNEYQFEREKLTSADSAVVGQDTKVESISTSHLPQSQLDSNNNYKTDEHEEESDQTLLPVEQSNEVLEVLDEDDSEAANVISKAVEDDQVITTAYISSPGSSLSWRPCRLTVCEPEENTHHTESESVPGFRGVTESQIFAYRTFCEDRANITSFCMGLTLGDSEKMENTAQIEPEDEDDENALFPYVDAVDELPSEQPDRDLLHSVTPESQYYLSDCCFVTEDNTSVQTKEVKENQISVKGEFPYDGDLDEISECDPDTTDVTLTTFNP